MTHTVVAPAPSPQSPVFAACPPCRSPQLLGRGAELFGRGARTPLCTTCQPSMEWSNCPPGRECPDVCRRA